MTGWKDLARLVNGLSILRCEVFKSNPYFVEYPVFGALLDETSMAS